MQFPLQGTAFDARIAGGGTDIAIAVAYLNGQIKGQDLIYRKSVNRFYPNTEKWVGYFVGKGDDATGRPVDRRSNRDARIHLGIDRMSRMPGYKSAAETTIDIQAEWKQACAHFGLKEEHGVNAVWTPKPTHSPGGIVQTSLILLGALSDLAKGWGRGTGPSRWGRRFGGNDVEIISCLCSEIPLDPIAFRSGISRMEQAGRPCRDSRCRPFSHSQRNFRPFSLRSPSKVPESGL